MSRQSFMLAQIDRHLDERVSQVYKDQPMAQDWARVAKVVEEAGEAIGNLILWTGQNPRKRNIGIKPELDDLLEELADVAATALLAMTHFTKDALKTMEVFDSKLERIYARALQWESEHQEVTPKT